MTCPRPSSWFFPASSLLLTSLAGAVHLLAAASTLAAPDYILFGRCTATMDGRRPLGGQRWQVGVPFVSIQLADGTGGWADRHSFKFETFAFCNGPNGYPEYGTGDDICMGPAAFLPGTLVYSTPTEAPDAASGSFSLTDSPASDHADSLNITATVTAAFDLAGYSNISLVYFHHHALRWIGNQDSCVVDVSTDGGTQWIKVRSHTNYLGDKGQFKRAVVDLSSLAGQTLRLRLRLSTDGSAISDDGWFIDDIRLLADGTTLFFDDFESGTGNWDLTPPWGLSIAGYSFESLGSIDAAGFYSTTPVTNPVDFGEGMGYAVVRATYTEGDVTRLAHVQVHHTSPQYKAAPELGEDALCSSPGSCVPAAVAEAQAAARRVILEQNHPNPFNPSTDIPFHLPEPSPVTLRIVDESGRIVRTLLDRAPLAAGAHGLSWNGLDAGGQRVASGVYFYELRVNGREHIRKMVLLQ